MEKTEEMSSPEIEKEPGHLIVITGPSSGAGKDSVAEEVAGGGGEEFARIATYTTRAPRADDKALHSITEEEFKRKEEEGFFFETNFLDGYWYGSPKEEVLQTLKQGKIVLLRVDVNGAKEIKEKQYPEAVTIFIWATMEEMEKRLRKRALKTGESEEKIREKLDRGREELKEMNADYIDHRVHNQEDKREEAVRKVLEIIEKERKTKKPLKYQ